MRRIIKILTGRLMLIVPLFWLQFAAIAVLIYHASIYIKVMPILNIVSILMVIMVVNSQSDPSYKIAWIIVLLALPVVGVPLYALAANRKMPKKLSNGTIRASQKMVGLLQTDESTLDDELAMRAIITYVRVHFGSPPDYERVKASYDEQKAQMMHATGYTDWGDCAC